MKFEHVKSLKCAVLRLQQDNLIIPVNLMAELVGQARVEEEAGVGLSGWLSWRNRRVPVISLEALCMHRPNTDISGEGKYLILSGVTGIAGLPFIAIQVQGGMQMVDLTEDSLRDDYSGNMSRCPYVARQVRISRLVCFIPDMPAIEAAVAEVLGLHNQAPDMVDVGEVEILDSVNNDGDE